MTLSPAYTITPAQHETVAKAKAKARAVRKHAKFQLGLWPAKAPAVAITADQMRDAQDLVHLLSNRIAHATTRADRAEKILGLLHREIARNNRHSLRLFLSAWRAAALSECRALECRSMERASAVQRRAA